MTDALLTNETRPIDQKAAQKWSAGGEGYDKISRQIADAIEHCVDRLDPEPGDRILDVATGTGWTARRIHARGAQVTGIDFGEDVIQAARHIDTSGQIDFQIADAESLPFADGTFDGVVSTFGVMFCGNPQRGAAELGRVCNPGGRLVLTTWPQQGSVIEMFNLIKKHLPEQPAPSPSPFDWGKRSRLEELLGDDFTLRFEEATSYYRAPNSASAWDAFSQGFGPVVTLLNKLDEHAATEFRREFDSFHDRYQTGAGILVPRPYLITVGTRNN